MKNIIPVSDLQRQAAAILNELNETHKPVVITQRGRASAVLLSAAQFEKIESDLERFEEQAVAREIELALKEINEGKTISLDEAKRRLGYTD